MRPWVERWMEPPAFFWRKICTNNGYIVGYIVVMGENNATIQWLNSRYYDCLVGGSNELSQGYPYFKDLDS